MTMNWIKHDLAVPAVAAATMLAVAVAQETQHWSSSRAMTSACGTSAPTTTA
jgi:hypothetical protein